MLFKVREVSVILAHLSPSSPGFCWRPHGRRRPVRCRPSSARPSPTGKSRRTPLCLMPPVAPSACCGSCGWQVGGWGTAATGTAVPAAGSLHTAGWGSVPSQAADSPAGGWWGWTPGPGGADREAGAVDRQSGHRVVAERETAAAPVRKESALLCCRGWAAAAGRSPGGCGCGCG